MQMPWRRRRQPRRRQRRRRRTHLGRRRSSHRASHAQPHAAHLRRAGIGNRTGTGIGNRNRNAMDGAPHRCCTSAVRSDRIGPNFDAILVLHNSIIYCSLSLALALGSGLGGSRIDRLQFRATAIDSMLRLNQVHDHGHRVAAYRIGERPSRVLAPAAHPAARGVIALCWCPPPNLFPRPPLCNCLPATGDPLPSD